MNTPGVLLSSSLLTWPSSLAKARQPKTRRWETAGLRPCQASYGVLPSSALVGERLRMLTAVTTASPQKIAGIPLCLRRARAIPTTVWLRRSMTPFFYGLWGAE
jgi:hypothetical protein